MSVHARMVMQNGAFVSDVGPEPDMSNRLSSSRKSALYGLTVDTSVRRSVLATDYQDLQTLGFLFTGILAMALFAFAILLPKGDRNNPITELERALKNGEFIPYYQPIVDITRAAQFHKFTNPNPIHRDRRSIPISNLVQPPISKGARRGASEERG